MWLWISAALMVATAGLHSWKGEVKLIMPLLRMREGVLRSDFSRTITRYAWHVTSALMVGSGITVAWPGVPLSLIGAIGAIWLAMGLTSLVVSRGKHLGWPVLSGAGICALIGAMG